jgi:ribokinase
MPPTVDQRRATSGPFVVIGDVFVDVVVRLGGPIALESDTPAQTRLLGGGSAANVAAWLAHVGCEVALVGSVGDDVLGRSQAADLAALGVDVHLAIDRALATGTCVVLVDANGRRTMFPDPGASEIQADALPTGLFRPGAHLHVPGYALLREGSRTAGLLAIERARAASMSVSIDASSAAPLRALGPNRFLDWIAGVDVLFANEAEAEVLIGVANPETAAAALATRVRGVAIKLGAQGSVWADGAGRVERMPAEACAVVDSTGAGDAFAAGFLAAFLAATGPRESLRAGAALAASALSRPGARPPREEPGAGRDARDVS